MIFKNIYVNQFSMYQCCFKDGSKGFQSMNFWGKMTNFQIAL